MPTPILNLPPKAILGPNTASESLEIRADAVLTSGYEYTSAVRVLGLKFLNLIIDYTKGDETSVQIIGQLGVNTDGTVEGTTWKGFYITLSPSTAGISEVVQHLLQLTAAAHAATSDGEVPVNVMGKQVVRFGVKATGGTPTGTIGISVTGSMEAVT